MRAFAWCYVQEVPFVFQYGPSLQGPGEVILAQRMGAFWATFAATHRPTPVPTGAWDWPANNVTAGVDLYMRMDVGPNMLVVEGGLW